MEQFKNFHFGKGDHLEFGIPGANKKTMLGIYIGRKYDETCSPVLKSTNFTALILIDFNKRLIKFLKNGRKKAPTHKGRK